MKWKTCFPVCDERFHCGFLFLHDPISFFVEHKSSKIKCNNTEKQNIIKNRGKFIAFSCVVFLITAHIMKCISLFCLRKKQTEFS